MAISAYKDRVSRPVIALLAAAMGIAFFIRTASFRNFINPEGGFFFYSVDAYDHLRRITLGVYSFPSVPTFDYYAGYPKGTGQLWSPLFDYIHSAVSLLFGGTRQTIETVSFFSGPAFAALTVVFIFLIARRAFSSDSAGIAAAFLIAFSPAHISYSIPMNFGHHVLEPLAVLLLFSLPFFEKDGGLSFKGRLSVALLLALAIFMWRGSTIYWAATFASVLIRSFLSGNKRLARDYAAGFAIAALALAAICLVDPWGSSSSISFGVISWFHVIVLLVLACVLLLFAVSKTKRSFAYAMAGLAGVGIVSLLVPQVMVFFSGIASGISFLRGTGDPWVESNIEWHGVFSRYDFFYTASYLTAAWFAAPLAAALALAEWKKGGMTDRFLITLAIWSPLLLLGLVIRYTLISGTMAALLCAYLFSYLWQRRGDFKSRALLVTGAVLLVIVPSFPHYKVFLTGDLPADLKYGLYGNSGALQWIKDSTPNTSYYLRPTRQPEYGILANWDLGAKIYYLAERPAMATAFGWETHGLYEQALFMTTEQPEIAYSILRDNRIRYVLLRAFENLRTDYSIARDGEVKNRLPRGITGNFNPQFSVYNRLMYGDGSAQSVRTSFIPALGNYRLVFEPDYLVEKKGLQSPVSYFKVFEAVRGAEIRGKGKPDTMVSISLPLMTSLKRTLLFQDMTITDKEGFFFFRVPYATDWKQGETVPLGQYTISGSGMPDVRVKVTETEVNEGLTVRVPHEGR